MLIIMMKEGLTGWSTQTSTENTQTQCKLERHEDQYIGSTPTKISCPTFGKQSSESWALNFSQVSPTILRRTGTPSSVKRTLSVIREARLRYRLIVHKFDFTALEGKEKWTVYKFVRNVFL